MAARTSTRPKKLTRAEQYNVDFAKEVARLARVRKGTFTVDDVMTKVGTPPQGGKALGALMHAAAAKLDLVQVGVQKSQRPSRRGALNRTWKRA